jgi:hypothetical protein
MWGYGFVLVLTTNKLLLIALQFTVALFSAWYFLRVVDESGLVDEWSRFWLRAFMMCCVLQRYSVREGRWLQMGTTLFGAIAAWAGLWSRKRAWFLVLVTIVYQYLSCSVAALQPQYVSNLILFQLLVCSNGVGALCSWWT